MTGAAHEVHLRDIAVEGPVGVGKTSLAKKLAASFGLELLPEPTFDNPFLERFYRQGKTFALPTQLFFLLRRGELLRNSEQGDLFLKGRVCDFILEKDRLFAELTLDADEFNLYEQLYDRLVPAIRHPELIIYLQAKPEVLLERIRMRGISAEQRIGRDYLQLLCDAYARFFHYYEGSRVLIVNADHVDLLNDDEQYQAMVQHIRNGGGPREYYNPSPRLI